jgi:ketosteroid isomerase-like protein
MPYRLCCIAVALCVAVSGNALTIAPAPDPTVRILALEQKWNDAYERGDLVTLHAILAEDFIITLEDGSTYSKSGYIAHSGDPDNKVKMSKMSDLRVRMHGKTAVVTGAYHEAGTSKGKPYDNRDRLTDVWMLIDGRWQVIASHYSLIER